MTKQDIVRRVAFEADITTELAARVVQRASDSITESLATDGGIELRGFGVFDVVMTKRRIARNPKTGEKVVVAPKARVRFGMGKEMGERVGSAPAQRSAAAGASAATIDRREPTSIDDDL